MDPHQGENGDAPALGSNPSPSQPAMPGPALQIPPRNAALPVTTNGVVIIGQPGRQAGSQAVVVRGWDVEEALGRSTPFRRRDPAKRRTALYTSSTKLVGFKSSTSSTLGIPCSALVGIFSPKSLPILVGTGIRHVIQIARDPPALPHVRCQNDRHRYPVEADLTVQTVKTWQLNKTGAFSFFESFCLAVATSDRLSACARYF